MAGDLVQFVDSIAASPTVRLDLNDGTTWSTRYDGTDVSPPPLKQAWAGTLLADGEQLVAAAYGNRRLKLALDLITTTVDGQAGELQKLWRELNRPGNILRWWTNGATNPVFFRTVRSSSTRVTEYPGSGTLRTMDVEIDAEPFAYGLKESIAALSVTNDPTAGSNGMFFDLPTIKGDVDTPLFLSVGTSVVAGGRRQSAIAVRRGGTPSAMPFVVQAESLTLGTDTTVQTDATAMWGTGGYARTSFNTNPNMTSRLTSGTFPASPGNDVRGTYRTYLRCRKTVGTDTISVKMTVGLGGTTISSDVVSVPAGTTMRFVDLGLLQFPLGYDPNGGDGYSGTVLPVRGQIMTISASRSGTGNLDVDGWLLVPADDRFTLVKWPDTGGPSSFVLDAAKNNAYAVGASNEVYAAQFTELAGLLPSVTPGVANRVYVILDVGSTSTAGDDKTATTQITPYYWPRYLSVRPVSS